MNEICNLDLSLVCEVAFRMHVTRLKNTRKSPSIETHLNMVDISFCYGDEMSIPAVISMWLNDTGVELTLSDVSGELLAVYVIEEKQLVFRGDIGMFSSDVTEDLESIIEEALRFKIDELVC